MAAFEELNQVVANRQPTIDTYAPLYCQSHQNVVTTFEDESYPSNDGSGWTQDESVKIIGILYDNDSTAEDIGNIVNAKVWIGMTHVELWYLVGNPDDINTSNYGGGNISRQLVYGSNYVYLDASNTVTSYQMY